MGTAVKAKNKKLYVLYLASYSDDKNQRLFLLRFILGTGSRSFSSTLESPCIKHSKNHVSTYYEVHKITFWQYV
jgi:hypothetical protein